MDRISAYWNALVARLGFPGAVAATAAAALLLLIVIAAL